LSPFVKDQRQRERGRKIYSLHAPEVECIGKGKAHKPYEVGVKVSVATPRLVPDAGKDLTEFSRSDEASAGVDLKLVKGGVEGSDSQKHGSVVLNDTIQSFRNFVAGSERGRNETACSCCLMSSMLSARNMEWDR
jgi:hypothetical protein